MNLQEFYQKRAKHYLGTAIGASASVLCLLGVRSDLGKFIGYSGLMVFTGYGVAMGASQFCKKTRERELYSRVIIANKVGIMWML